MVVVYKTLVWNQVKKMIRSRQLDWTHIQEMLAEANARNQRKPTRYEKYAEAQAWLIDSGLTMPNLSLGGTPSVTKTVPFSRSYSLVGIKDWIKQLF